MASTYACPNGAQTLPDSLRGLSASPFYDCAVYFFLISNTLDSTYNLMGSFKETLIESFFSVQGQDGPHHCFNRFFFSLCRYFLKGHGRVIFWCSWIHPD